MFKLDFSQMEVLSLLIKSEVPISIENIKTTFNISKRTVYYITNKINRELQYHKINPIKNERGKGYYLDNHQKKVVTSIINQSDFTLQLSHEERKNYLICWLSYPIEPVYVDSIMEHFQISRNTVFNDLKIIKSELIKHDLKLNFDLKAGYIIEGSPFNKRAIILYNLKYILKKLHYKSIHFLSPSEIDVYYNRLNIISTKKGNEYNNNYLIEISCLLCIIKRANEKFDFSILELKDLVKTDELKLIDNYFQDFNVHERLYLAIHLLGSKATNIVKDDNSDNDIRLFELAQKLADIFERISFISLVDKNDLINSLYMHFKLSMYYYKLSIQTINPLIAEVKTSYRDVYNIVEVSCKKMEGYFPFPLNESEKVYITMHFGGHLSKGSKDFYKHIRVLVVCPSGISTSTLLKREIENLYFNLKVIATTTISNIYEYEDEVDFIVSTVDIETELPWIKVNTILSRNDKSRIASLIVLNFSSYNSSDIELNGLIDVLSKYVEQYKIKEMKSDIIEYLRKGNVIVNVIEHEKGRLKDLLTSEDIIIIDTYIEWEEAIRVASQPLLTANKIKNKYIDAMIELVKNYGPYIVLQNGVAIAHAKSSQGANILGVSLLVSRKEISFEGSGVNLIFVLSSPNQEKHIQILKDIMRLSANENDIIKQIIKSENSKDVLDSIITI